MRTIAVETDLSMEDFSNYFEKRKLGYLHLPNGQNLYISLLDLYKLVSDWKINKTEIPIEDIIAVIAFGSAVRSPGTKETTAFRKKFFFFGPQISKVVQTPICPSDVDFFVLTGQDLTSDKVLNPILRGVDYGGVYLVEGGIHVVNRGASQLLNGVNARDSVSISALKEGVPIFFNGRFNDVRVQAGIFKETPRKILWSENYKGFLNGQII